MAPYVGLIAAVAALLAFRYAMKNKNPRRGNLPPSPPSLPLLGHLHLMGPLLHRSLHQLHLRHGSDGGLLLVQLGRRRTLVVSTAAADLFKNHDLAFASRPHNAAADKLIYGSSNVSFAPYGDDWRRGKKMAVAHLLSPRRAESFAPVRAAEAAALVARTRRTAAAGETVELRELLYEYNNAVVTRAATGAAGTAAERLKRLLGSSAALLSGLQADDLLADAAARMVRWATGLERKLDAELKEWDEFRARLDCG